MKAGWIVAGSGVLGVVGIVLGLLAWRADLPSQYTASEVAYRTWGLFLVEFMDEGIALPVGTVLNVARSIDKCLWCSLGPGRVPLDPREALVCKALATPLVRLACRGVGSTTTTAFTAD